MLRPIVGARLQSCQGRKGGDGGNDTGNAIDSTLNLTKDDPKYDTPGRLVHELLHNLWAASLHLVV